jgi:asparagine synthase (glutamine-hydrolysing)
VADSVRGEEKVAVAFSGGLDSSVVAACAMRHTNAFGCAAFSRGSRDATWARRAAGMMKLELMVTELTRENVASALAGIELPFEPSLMDRSLWCLYSLVARSARQSGARVILLGQLADELFGGYAKYAEALEGEGEASARAMMTLDLENYAKAGRVRDVRACEPWIQPRLPFEAKEVVEFAASLPVSYKIREGVRKAVLRRAALALGVPDELAVGAKKAAQYSSGVQKLLA